MGNSPTKQAKKLVFKGDGFYRKDEFERAIVLYLKAYQQLQTRTKYLTTNASATKKNKKPVAQSQKAQVFCLDHLVRAYWRLGEIEEALGYAQKSLVIAEQHCPSSKELAGCLNNLGCLFFERGETAKGHYLLEAALEIRQTIEPDSHSTARACNNMAIILRQMGHDAEASKLDEQAYSIKKKKCPDSYSMVTTQVALVATAKSTTVARKHLDRAHKLVQKMNPAVQSKTSALALIENAEGNWIVRTQGKRGARLAISHLKKAVQLEESVAGDSLILASLCESLSKAYTLGGLHKEAETANSRAMAIRRRKAPILLEQKKIDKK